ncbi:MAG: hypothetical protein AAF206_08150 [Bacteroidota bacterium]
MKHIFFLILLVLTAGKAFAQEIEIEHVCGLDSSVSYRWLADQNQPVLDGDLISHLNRVIKLFLPNTPSARYTLREIKGYPIAAAHHQRIKNAYPRVITINHEYFSSLTNMESEKEALLIWIIAHELTHHISGDNHYLLSGKQTENLIKEIYADERAGFAVGALTGVDIEFFQQILPKFLNNGHETNTHPGNNDRILAAQAGWLTAKVPIRRTKPREINGRSFLDNGVSMGQVNNYGVFNGIFRKTYEIEVNDTIIQREIIGNLNDQQKCIVISRLVPHGFDQQIYFGWFRKNVKEEYTLHGHGRMYYPNGRYYWGEFKDNLKNGQGFEKKNGPFDYSGAFLNDLYHGYGRARYPSGRMYKGHWKEGKRHGDGILYRGNTIISNGCWENDIFKGDHCK